MLDFLDRMDETLFLYLNDLHTPWVDKIMFYVTDTEFWYPLYALIIGLIAWKYKKSALPYLIAAVLAVGISDLITSGIMKPLFERLRPCYNPEIMQIVHLIDDCGAPFGFASGHASNSFSIATFLVITFRKQYSWIWIMFLWAFLVSYSRIYVGVHYPGDVLTGSLIGLAAGIAISHYYYRVVNWKFPHLRI